jgi:rhodanese-related sulfurtransferase
MKTYQDLIKECSPAIKEVMPWELSDQLKQPNNILLLDIREPYEYQAVHILNSINVPRGILEAACDYGYEETVPELVTAREREVIVMCRSGNRSVLAAYVMQLMGYKNVKSLRSGVRGWNDYEQPLYDANKKLMDSDRADIILSVPLRLEQLDPSKPLPRSYSKN